MSFLDRHAERTERYVDSLIAVDSAAADVPADARVDPEIRRAARLLRMGIVRVHPSFLFEERLAGRLALAASGAGLAPTRDHVPAEIVPLARRLRALGSAAASGGGASASGAWLAVRSMNVPSVPAVPSIGAPFVVPPGAVRPIVVGGALSLAGAAFIAWRRSRPQPSGAHWPARAGLALLGSALPGRGGPA